MTEVRAAEEASARLSGGLSVEDGEPIYLYHAIKSGVLHGTVLSVGLGQQLK